MAVSSLAEYTRGMIDRRMGYPPREMGPDYKTGYGHEYAMEQQDTALSIQMMQAIEPHKGWKQ